MPDLSKSDLELVITTDMLMWLGVRALMLVAMRHPEIPSEVRSMGVIFLKHLEKKFKATGYMSVTELRETAEGIPELLKSNCDG